MDHPHYPFSALPSRPPLAWPDGARVAFWVLLHLEHWELTPPADAVRDARFVSEFGNFAPDYRTWSQREYGNRVGIFRILDVLDRHGIKASVAAGAAACALYPGLIEECRRRNYEFIAHGSYATRLISSRMSEAEERAAIGESIAAVERATGRRPRGWLGQDHGESARTPGLLAEAGIDYVLDWANDDQPYAMTVGRPMIAIPNQVEWDDIQLFWIRRVDSWRYPALVGEAFEVLYEEGARSGRSFVISLHPWLFGMAQRIRYLDEALDRLAGRPAVWQATAGEIAAWCLQKLD
jgi:peptidoglycan/xylan/chitin deacetylase (PgdA/CDA1 family)